MSNEEKTKQFEEIFMLSKNFIVREVRNVNHEPHPYMIGPKHIEHACKHYGGILENATIEAVKCAHPRCGLDYESHTYDTVLFLSLKKNVLRLDAQTELQYAIKEVGEDFVTGITFVDTKEKFRVKEVL